MLTQYSSKFFSSIKSNATLQQIMVVLALLTVGPILAQDAQPPDSSQPPPGVELLMEEHSVPAYTQPGAKALVVQNCIPWLNDSVVKALGELGVPHDRINSATLAAKDLTPYQFVMLVGSQDTTFYQDIVTQINR